MNTMWPQDGSNFDETKRSRLVGVDVFIVGKSKIPWLVLDSFNLFQLDILQILGFGFLLELFQLFLRFFHQ